MKPTLFSMVVLACKAVAFAQGELGFANHAPSLIDAPVFDTDGQTRLAGAAFLWQFFAGLTPSTLKATGPSGVFNTGAAAGYMASDTDGFVAGSSDDTVCYVQMRAWEASAGATFEAAVAAGGKYGFSNIVPEVAVVPPGGGYNLPVGFESFRLMATLGHQPKLAITLLANPEQPLVEVIGIQGWNVTLQSSTNLVGWSPVATNALSGVLWIYQDSPPTAGNRFYRAQLTVNP
jgi:hypothetical protein